MKYMEPQSCNRKREINQKSSRKQTWQTICNVLEKKNMLIVVYIKN